MCLFADKKRSVNGNLQINEENTRCEKSGNIRKWIRVSIDDSRNEKAVVVGLNPSTADEKESDYTLTRTARFLSQYDVRQFTMINLFETVSKKPSGIQREHLCNLEEYRPILEDADMIFIAWGTEGYREEKRDAAKYLLQFKEKVCCVKHESVNKEAVHPRRIRYKDELVYYYSLEKRRRHRVVTLCGSTRFREHFMEVQKRLTLEGNIVLSVGLFGHSGDGEVWEGMDEGTWTDTKKMLDEMHKEKIDMSDEIFVINVGGYIGESTQSEIEYARRRGKTIRYLED